MNKLFRTINKAGYSISTTGDDIFPAVIISNNEPVGFILEDLKISLISGKEDLRQSIEDPISFALDYQDFDDINGDAVLTSYKDVVLTASYDYESSKTKFNVCKKNEDGLEILHSGYERDAVTTEYTKLSGLIGNQPDTPKHIQTFLDNVKQLGYSISSRVTEDMRKYDILTANGDVIGYINKSNAFTLVSADKEHRKLNKVYSKSNSAVQQTPFVERLKNSLILSGLALKGLFDKNGDASYQIQENGKVIATMDDKNVIKYAEQATPEKVTQIERLIQEDIQEKRPTEALEHTPTGNALSFSEADIISLLSAIAQIPAVQQYLPVELQEKLNVQQAPEIISQIQDKPEIEISEPTPLQSEIPIEPIVNELPKLTPYQQELLNSFDNQLELISVNESLNPEQVVEISARVEKMYATADRNEFMKNLVSGKYEKQPLEAKVEMAKAKADMKNDIIQAETREKVQEQTQEKEK